MTGSGVTFRSWLSEARWWTQVVCVAPLLTIFVYWTLAWEATLHFRTWDGRWRDKFLSFASFVLYVPLNYIGPGRRDSWREMWRQAFECSAKNTAAQRAIEERDRKEAAMLRARDTC